MSEQTKKLITPLTEEEKLYYIERKKMVAKYLDSLEAVTEDIPCEVVEPKLLTDKA